MFSLLLLLAGCPPTDTPKDTATDTDAVVCGTLTCTAPDVCVQESYPPDCVDRADTGAACPEGTTPTRCGGDGSPCCCGPTPDLTYTCHDASACGDTPACDCLGEVCPSGKECMSVASETSRIFSCDELPKP